MISNRKRNEKEEEKLTCPGDIAQCLLGAFLIPPLLLKRVVIILSENECIIPVKKIIKVSHVKRN